MGANVKRLKKSSVLARLEQLRLTAEENEIQPVYLLAVIDTLLDYAGDPEIRAKVEEIAL
jgi:hypothetical protein